MKNKSVACTVHKVMLNPHNGSSLFTKASGKQGAELKQVRKKERQMKIHDMCGRGFAGKDCLGPPKYSRNWQKGKFLM